MALDISIQLVGLVVLGGLSLLCIAAIFCSGRAEELDAGLATVLPEPSEDYIADPRELTVANLEAAWALHAPMREDALHAKPYNVEEDL